MSKGRMGQVAGGILLALMFLFLVVAVPSGTLTLEAQKRYLEEAPASPEDEYSFLFDQEGD